MSIAHDQLEAVLHKGTAEILVSGSLIPENIIRDRGKLKLVLMEHIQDRSGIVDNHVDMNFGIFPVKAGNKGGHDIDADKIGRSEIQGAGLQSVDLTQILNGEVICRDHLLGIAKEVLPFHREIAPGTDSVEEGNAKLFFKGLNPFAQSWLGNVK